jgi:hypothetical protein
MTRRESNRTPWAVGVSSSRARDDWPDAQAIAILDCELRAALPKCRLLNIERLIPDVPGPDSD